MKSLYLKKLIKEIAEEVYQEYQEYISDKYAEYRAYQKSPQLKVVLTLYHYSETDIDWYISSTLSLDTPIEEDIQGELILKYDPENSVQDFDTVDNLMIPIESLVEDILSKLEY